MTDPWAASTSRNAKCLLQIGRKWDPLCERESKVRALENVHSVSHITPALATSHNLLLAESDTDTDTNIMLNKT